MVDKPVRGQNDWDIPLNEALDWLEANSIAKADAARLAVQAWVGAQVEAAKDRSTHTGTQPASTITGLFVPSGPGGTVAEDQLDPAVLAKIGTAYGSAWNSEVLLQLGNYFLWVDATGALRIKNGRPTSDLDGNAIGQAGTNLDSGYPPVYGHAAAA